MGEMTIDEGVLSDNNTDTVEPDEDELSGFEAIEKTFGDGAKQKVLLVTQGISVKNLVESSK